MTEGIDSPLASAPVVAIAEDEPSLSVANVPPLGWLASLAALAELVIARVLVNMGHDMWPGAALLHVDRVGRFARNLSVVSALVALGFCLVAFSSRRSGLPLSGRAGIAGFGWLLIPIVTLMTFLPLEWTRVQLVLVVAGLAHALVLLLILAGLHWRSTAPALAAQVLMLVAAFSGVVSMAITVIGGREYWANTERLSNAFRWSGELAYLAVPLAIGFAVAIPWRTARGKATIALSALAAGLVATGMALWQRAAGEDFPMLLYGALRLDLLPDAYALFYAIPLGIGAAVTVAAVLSNDPVRRQLGASLLLLLSAGYAPRTPGTLIIMVLGVALLARAAISFAQRRKTA